MKKLFDLLKTFVTDGNLQPKVDFRKYYFYKKNYLRLEKLIKQGYLLNITRA